MTTEVKQLSESEQDRLRMKAGVPAPGVKIRLRDEDDEDVPHDGESPGEVQARAPWLAGEYYERPDATEASFSDDGWFCSGDVATLDEYGYLDVVDRLDDVIKSGGEWISSIELENALIGHDGVEEATVIGVPTRSGRNARCVRRHGRRRDRRRPARVPPRAVPEVVAAGPLRVRRQSAEDDHREVRQEGARRAVRVRARVAARRGLTATAVRPLNFRLFSGSRLSNSSGLAPNSRTFVITEVRTFSTVFPWFL